jgi:alpha-amylase/alpha-mannosidase (GH57 family)
MAASKRFVCIHGHFYQPPRENPWLETVETQDSAAPYHDWNERICAECYATNGAARIQNSKNQITRIVNNYARMSFNFGPTLLSWLRDNAPRTHRMIVDGERRSRRTFKGHSSALAQVYNHIIMPLANDRDRITQIRWGMTDYHYHYGAPPDGMWLAETAADSRTLELLAENGVKFTVLAPHQCKRVRPLKADPTVEGVDLPGTDEAVQAETEASVAPAPAPAVKGSASPKEPKEIVWIDTPDATVDTTRPYVVRFKSGQSLAVFFYDGPTSRAIAFEGLLNSGENFVARLKSEFKDNTQPQLVHVATDGESYGHHHKHGEMALAYAARLLEQDKTVKLTNYGNFLAQFPPEYECEIVENSSWSCAHGVERWRSNCGCNGGKPGWNQEWRGPLREALDELRDAIAPLTEELGKKLFKDVWAARNSYIQVILYRSNDSTDRFFNESQHHSLSAEERVRALELMELQRNAQLMYTSCGWFFDDISGIETVQVIAYAARVLQLAREVFGERAAGLETAFVTRLKEAKSNVPSAGDGARIYTEKIHPMELGLEQVVAHYAISSVFSSFAEDTDLFCYHVRRTSYDVFTSGRGRLALGRAHVGSAITGAQRSFSFAVLHFGDQNITAAVKSYANSDAPAFDEFAAKVAEQVQRADFPDVIRMIDRHYGHVDYSLTSLFTDEQRRIVQLILNSTLWDIENSLTTIYEDHASLLHFLSQAGLPKPPALTLAAGFAINAGLRRALEGDPIDVATMRSFLQLAKSDQVPLESTTLSYIADQRMKRAMIELQLSAGSLEILDRALMLARTMMEMPFDLNMWQAQNVWYEILRSSGYALTALADDERPKWENDFSELGICLSIDTKAISEQDQLAETTGD